MEYNIKDAFRELDILNEAEEFNLTREWDVDKLHDILTRDIEDDIIDVVDPGLAEDQPTLVDGDCVMQCTVCGTNQFKHPEDLVLDEESELYNIEEECIYCHQLGGFKKIGIFKACDGVECPEVGEEAAALQEPTEEPPVIEENHKEPLKESRFTKAQLENALKNYWSKKISGTSDIKEATDEDNNYMSPADIRGMRQRELQEEGLNEARITKDQLIAGARRLLGKQVENLNEADEEEERWCDRLDKMTKSKAITEAEDDDSLEETPVDEERAIEDTDLDELHDESKLAYTYYNFIPEDLYNDVKSGIADISQISEDALNAILDKGDFTEDQIKYLKSEREALIDNKFIDFAKNLKD